jgi:hypothetical protein
MDIAVAMIAHDFPDVLQDTLDSIKTWMTDKVHITVDASHWNSFKNFFHPVELGFHHNYFRSPYKNVALSLKRTYEKFPDVDWICYCEYDCLVASNLFEKELKDAKKRGIWVLANDVRIRNHSLPPLFRKIFDKDIGPTYINLGCCVFYRNQFIEKLVETDFFNKFFELTKEFNQGYFPDFFEHALEENLFGTLASYYGGGVEELASWAGSWRGLWQKYPMRAPEEIPLQDISVSTTIIHPLKRYDNPIREHYRKMRAKTK